MKFAMQKDNVLNVLTKMSEVANKGIRSDYEFGKRVTLQVMKDSKVVFTSSNGHLDVEIAYPAERDTNLVDTQPGQCTVDVGVLTSTVSALPTGSPTSPIQFEFNEKMLEIVAEPNATKRKKIVKLEVDPQNHTLDLSRLKGDKFEMEVDPFLKGIAAVSPFVSKLGYKVQYHMICFHFLPSQTRMVCGDGMCFAVYSLPFKSGNVSDPDGARFIIPVNQAQIIAKLVSDEKKVELTWKNPTTCYIQPSEHTRILLKGIPLETYIAYDTHAFRTGEAKAIMDIKCEDLAASVNVAGALQGGDQQDMNFLSVKFHVASDTGVLSVDEGKYRGSIDNPVNYYDIKGQPEFKSEYAHKFLAQIARACNKDMMRFYLIDPSGVVITKTMDLVDQKDGSGVPMEKIEENESSLSFFFASVHQQ